MQPFEPPPLLLLLMLPRQLWQGIELLSPRLEEPLSVEEVQKLPLHLPPHGERAAQSSASFAWAAAEWKRWQMYLSPEVAFLAGVVGERGVEAVVTWADAAVLSSFNYH